MTAKIHSPVQYATVVPKFLQGTVTAGLTRNFSRPIYIPQADKIVVSTNTTQYGMAENIYKPFTETVAVPDAFPAVIMAPDMTNGTILVCNRLKIAQLSYDGLTTTPQAGLSIGGNVLCAFTLSGDNRHFTMGTDLFWTNDFFATLNTVPNFSIDDIRACYQDPLGNFVVVSWGVAGDNTIRIAYIEAGSDPTDFGQWTYATPTSPIITVNQIGANPSGSRIVLGSTAGDVYIWDVGSDPYFIPSSDIWIGPTTSNDIVCCTYHPTLQGFILATLKNEVGFIPDGTKKVQGVFMITYGQPVTYQSQAGGGPQGSYDPNTDTVAWAPGVAGSSFARDRIIMTLTPK